jgi:phage terminase large subunit
MSSIPGTTKYKNLEDDFSVLLNDLPHGSDVIDLGYRPRPYQQILHSRLRRFNVIVCHRRFGKTVFSIAEMIDQGLNNPLKNPQYAYIAPTYGQAKRVAWEYLKDFCRKIPGAKANEADLRIDIPRPDKGDKIRFMLLGAENPDSLRGIYLDGVILDEYAQCDPIIWGQVIRPALSDRKGWAIFIGTPKGQNHFWDIYQNAISASVASDNWYVAMYKASETGVLDDEELAEAKMTMSEEEYEQEYECSFSAALIGAYYGKYINELEKKGRIIDFNYDPTCSVSTYWDLGISDTTAIWFVQRVGSEIRVIDYIENGGVGLEWYAKEIQNRPYIYERHGIPHDGAARELGTGRSRQETLLDYGIRTDIIPRQSVADGINAVRILLQKNIWFHSTNCKRGLDALKNYQRKYDSKNQIFLDSPLHNWASNGADAFRMMGLDLQLPENRFNIREYERIAISDYNELGD